MTAVEEQAIDDIELKHQAEEPEGTRPYIVVRVRIPVVDHQQLSDDLLYIVFPRTGCDCVDNGEAYETHNHHLEKLEIMVADERERCHAVVFKGWSRPATVLPFQAVGAEEEEDGHTVMAEERDEMAREQAAGTGDALCQPVDVALEILIFVFLHHRVEPVAVVMKEDT